MFFTQVMLLVSVPLIENMCSYLDALEPLVSHSQLLGDLVVVSSHGAELLLQLGTAAGQVHVDDRQLVDACRGLLNGLLQGALGAEGLRKMVEVSGSEGI